MEVGDEVKVSIGGKSVTGRVKEIRDDGKVTVTVVVTRKGKPVDRDVTRSPAFVEPP